MPRAALALVPLLLAAAAAHGQSVAVQGVLGGKALLVVDGSAPKTVAAGETWKGVKVVSAAGDQAVLEVGGKRQTVRVGEAPGSFAGGGAGPSGTRIVLTVGPGGHFTSQGSINGRAAMFMVDTGASVVGLGQGDAERLGIDYKAGQPVRMSTANGVVPAWRVSLASVRIGEVELRDVDAVVGTASMPYVLLGNSFLGRFSMRRDNEQMVLERRY